MRVCGHFITGNHGESAISGVPFATVVIDAGRSLTGHRAIPAVRPLLHVYVGSFSALLHTDQCA